MELWIRSQDKRKLIPIKEELNIPYSKTGEDFEIFYKDNILAHFKKEERALEVLNEIHQRLIDLQTLEYLQGTMNLDWKHNRNIDCVYEMPKD